MFNNETIFPRKSLSSAGVMLLDCDHRTPKPSLSGYPYVAIPDIQNYRITLSNVRLISQADYDSWTKKTKPQTGDIVMTRRGRVGDIAAVPEGLECAIGQDLVILRSDEKQVLQRYLKWALRGPLYEREVQKYLNVGAIFYSLNCGDIPKFEIPVPSIPEQLAISVVLESLESKLELNQRMNCTLETIGQTLFKRWFVDFEFPDEEGKPYKSSGGEMVLNEIMGKPIPKGWQVGEINDLCSSITNGGTPKRMENKYWNGNIPWFKTGELTDGPLIDSEEHITEEGLRNSAARLWDVNTILIALYASPTVGRLGLLKTKAASNQACSGLVAKEEIGYSFLFYTLFFKRSELNNIAVGAAQQNISQQIVRESKTVIPPAALLRSFNDMANSLFDKKSAIVVQNRTLSQIRDELLPKLMSGKIRVPIQREGVTNNV